MVEQRALAWEESACDFEGFSMPKFTLQLTVFLYFWLEVIGSRLEQEAHLRAHAKIRDDQDRQFAKKRVSTELNLIIGLL